MLHLTCSWHYSWIKLLIYMLYKPTECSQSYVITVQTLSALLKSVLKGKKEVKQTSLVKPVFLTNCPKVWRSFKAQVVAWLVLITVHRLIRHEIWVALAGWETTGSSRPFLVPFGYKAEVWLFLSCWNLQYCMYFKKKT